MKTKFIILSLGLILAQCENAMGYLLYVKNNRSVAVGFTLYFQTSFMPTQYSSSFTLSKDELLIVDMQDSYITIIENGGRTYQPLATKFLPFSLNVEKRGLKAVFKDGGGLEWSRV